MKTHSLLLASLVVGVLVVLPGLTLAAATDSPATGPLGEIIPSVCLGTQPAPPAPQCGVREMVQIAINLSRIMLGLLGSVTLLIFIYGGFVWLTSSGNAQQVEHWRKVFEGALVGLVIVLASWVIINFVIAALTGTPVGEPPMLFNSTTPQAPFQIK